MRAKFKAVLFGSKKRKALATLLAFGLLGGSALAAYVILNNAGSGSGTETLATAQQANPMQFTVSWVPGTLTPGDEAQVFVKVANPNNVTGTITPANLTGTFTTNAQGCDPSWFTYIPDTSGATGQVAETIPANASAFQLDGSNPGGGPGYIKFTDLSSAAQDACSGAQLTLTLSDSNG